MNRAQMVGTQRSGSNMLREILSGLHSVFAPSSVHLLRIFAPLAASYGDLSLLRARRILAAEMLGLVSLNVQEWPRPLPGAEAVALEATRPTVFGVFVALHDVATRNAQASGWVTKCLENVHYMGKLVKHDAQMRFVHVLRDGRDVGLSLREAPIGEKDPRVAARRWAADQAALRTFASHASPTVFEWRYETFSVSPEETMERLCEFLGAEWDSAALDFHLRDSARKTAAKSSLWRNLSTPIIRDNYGKFRNPAEAEYVASFERVAADELRAWGYEPIYAMKSVELSETEWAEAEAHDRELVEEVERRAEPDAARIHEPYQAYIRELRARRGGSERASFGECE